MTTALDSTSLSGAAPSQVPSNGSAPDDSATLLALLRDACQRRERRGFLVRVAGREGHVFVADGRVVHAELAGLRGSRAIWEMLDAEGIWIHRATRSFPARSSLSLLPSELVASHPSRSGVRRSAEVLGEPTRILSKPAMRPELLPPRRSVAHRPTLPAPPLSPAARATVASESELTLVRLSAAGAMLAARGERSEKLANVAALLHHTARLIGEDLGEPARPHLQLEGGGQSLLVLSGRHRRLSAALGATSRLAELSMKAGLS